ncbi:Pol polyprotein, partial [Chelydra serpentina]
GFQTATGRPIQHLALVHRLLDALQAPRVVAIVHCRAHTRESRPVTQGNALADQAEKTAAIQPLALPTLALASSPFLPLLQGLTVP